MMRTLALVLLAAGLCVPAHGAPSEASRAHRSAFLSISLPDSFQPGREVEVRPGVTIQMFSETETHAEAGTGVILESFSGLSWFQRFFFKRGVGLRRSLPTLSFDRVPVSSFPLSDDIASSAGAAFTVKGSENSVGVVVRGCEGTWCYSVSANGPAPPGDASGLRYADLLSSLRIEN